MKYFDAFSGYGGFSLGIQQAYEDIKSRESLQGSEWGDIRPIGNQPNTTLGSDEQSETRGNRKLEQPENIGYSEIDKYAVQIYNKHFPEHKNYGDITKINASELPDFDLFVGGFPCQAFSIAGKRAGFEDTRGTLIYDVLRIVKEKHPRLVLLENVKGLLSHDGGRTFKTIISSLAELGYAVEWQVLNAKNFGVPQNRERVFIVGHLGGFGGRQVFPFGGDDSENISENKVREIHEPFPETHRLSDAFRIRGTDGTSATLKGLGGGMGAKTGLYAIPVLTPDRVEKRQNGRRFKEDGDPSFTLTGQDKHGIYDGMKIRRLTPTECERLMGLPDSWTTEGSEGKISDSQRYKLCGNGVVVNVVEEIIKRLL